MTFKMHGSRSPEMPKLPLEFEGQWMFVMRPTLMPPVRALFLSVVLAAASVSAQETPVPEVFIPEGEPQIEIRRAIPVETGPAVATAQRKAVYNRCEVPAPVIALTFDDGPHPDLTPKLLDMLKARGLKATFFLVGRNVANFPAIVKRMVDEGHEVANHSWSHPLLTSLGQDSVESQIRKTHDAIVKACGVAPTLYRPPYGAIRLTQRKKIQETFGYTAIIWDVDPQDWQSPRTVQKVHERVMKQTKSGSIILCHDIHATTVDAMPATLDALQALGYQFATVSQLIELEMMSAQEAAVVAPAILPGDAAPAAVTLPAAASPAPVPAPAPAPLPASP